MIFNARDETVLKDAEKALAQIEDRDYVHGLSGRIIMYGIAFRGKEPRIVSKVIDRIPMSM